jgi:hypothetical protein
MLRNSSDYHERMSCIRFNTPAQERQLDVLNSNPILNAESVAAFLSPDVTETKIARLRSMAKDRNFRIRESAALHKHTPEECFWALAKDRVESVRICVARNEATPCDVLRLLAKDKSEQVRSWVAVNYFVPADVMQDLAEDSSESVRQLVTWKSSLALQDA